MNQNGTVFREQDLELMRRPLDQATPPPAYYYTSPALYELEVREIFLKEWLWVGHVEQVQNPGDYFTFTVVNEPLVVVRDQGGELRAFSAVCRHRGAIVATGAGNCKAFTCPYHSWTYALSGKLIGAPEMEKVKGFDAGQYGLIALKVETWEGIIFVNFDAQSKPLAASLGDLPEYVKNYKLGEMVCTEHREYDFPCNWKMAVENQLEAYHIIGTHHTLAGTELYSLDNWRIKAEQNGLYGAVVAYSSEPTTLNVPGSVGEPAFIIEGLTEKQRREQYYFVVYPGQMFVFLPDCVVCFVMYPNGTNHTKVIVDWHFPKPLIDRPGFQEAAKAIYDTGDVFNDQDGRVLGLTYRGYQSRFFTPGRLSLHESNVQRFIRYVLNRVLDEETPAR